MPFVIGASGWRGYFTDLFADRAVRKRPHQRSFFLSLQYNAPHWPWEGPNHQALATRRAEGDAVTGTVQTPKTRPASCFRASCELYRKNPIHRRAGAPLAGESNEVPHSSERLSILHGRGPVSYCLRYQPTSPITPYPVDRASVVPASRIAPPRVSGNRSLVSSSPPGFSMAPTFSSARACSNAL
jgi:hypothetical protein